MNKHFSRNKLYIAVLAVGSSLMISSTALAQANTPRVAPENIEEVSVLGSRRVDARSATDAAVPIDVLSQTEIKSQGSTDILDVLTNIVPSYNVSREPISDAGTLVRPANLRGLPSDSTLVLVNGKRRHRGAVIGEFISGVNKGAQGVDLSPLPGIAMKQVEVLRDGAAAQYGSDAIAGVINFNLADDPQARELQVQYGKYFEGDGAIKEISGLFGTQLGQEGFATLAFEMKETDPTSRGIQDPSAQALADSGIRDVPNPVVIWGTPEISDDYKLMFNAAVEAGENQELYAFGNYATRDTDGSFFYRNPTNRAGVYSNDSGESLLVADVTADGSGNCQTDPGALEAVVADPNCFVFNEIAPGGFTPRFGGTVIDTSFTTGLRGMFGSNLSYDFSASIGSSEIQYQIRNTVSASFGPESQRDFDLGTQKQSEKVFNADFSYPVDIGMASDLNIAFGAQIHKEEFQIAAGETQSYAPGPYVDQGFSIGANGFQGFSPDVSGRFDRTSKAVYLDLEVDITDRWLLSSALRTEDFDDFGTTLDGKIATRFDIADNFSLRGAVSTGFRAPTVGQSNLRRSATSFEAGQLIETLVVAPTSPVAVQLGGEQLEPEESQSLSIGAVFAIGPFDITVDYFSIDVDDRLSLREASLTDADRVTLINSGVANANDIGTVSFFVNDFNSKTTGFDIVATGSFEYSFGTSDVSLAFNKTKTEIGGGDNISLQRVNELERSLPGSRLTLTEIHNIGNWTFLARGNFYDETFEYVFNDSTIPATTPAVFYLDLEVGYQLTDNIKLSLGGKNVFDEYPDEWQTEDGQNGRLPGYLGAIYPLNSAVGFNGGYYYGRMNISF